MMEGLFDKIVDVNDLTYRNVVKVTQDFSEISHSDVENDAIDLVLGIIGKTRTLDPLSEFYYMTAIGYPFEIDHYSSSRFSDGSFPVWYGSFESNTTIYETAYHMFLDEFDITTQSVDDIIYRDRSIYTVYCDGIMIDLEGKEQSHVDLISDSYQLTQQIGKKLYDQGHPGLISHSARCEGRNVNVFSMNVLSNPKPSIEVTYELNKSAKAIRVFFEKSDNYFTINY